MQESKLNELEVYDSISISIFIKPYENSNLNIEILEKDDLKKFNLENNILNIKLKIENDLNIIFYGNNTSNNDIFIKNDFYSKKAQENFHLFKKI